MNTARQALIAILSVATFAAAAPVIAAPQQAEISTLPTITVIGKRLPLQTITIVAKRLTAQEKLAMDQQDGMLPTITIVGKRLSREQKTVLAQQDSRKKAVAKPAPTRHAVA